MQVRDLSHDYRQSVLLKAVYLIALLLVGVPFPAKAGGLIEPHNSEDPIVVPQDLKPFVHAQEQAIFLQTVDLNRDGTEDYLMVTESNEDGEAADNLPRHLLIILRDKAGRLLLAKQNDRIIDCRVCGGMIGDPFSGVEITKKGFDVVMSGGSRERWTYTYGFNYSRLDKTWQLVKAEEILYDITNPEKTSTQLKTPPKDFGKVDIADFNPQSFFDR